jgi:hypothetical protein
MLTDRRRFITSSACGILLAATPSMCHAFPQQGGTPAPDGLNGLKPPSSGAEWLERALASQKKGVDGPLKLSRFVERMFFLLAPIEWDRNPGQTGPKQVIAPTGFVTDLASIPRPLWSIWPSDGSYAYPAIIHDFLYWTQPCSRPEADNVLKFAMQDFKIGTVTIDAIYDGVRLGGQASWDDNAKLKANGERRVLKNFPQDPTTHWSDWKKDKSNFVN